MLFSVKKLSINIFFISCITITASAAYLNRPELVNFNSAGTNICSKENLRIKFDHENFEAGNIFTVEISQNGTFTVGNTYTMLGSLTQSGNMQNVFLDVTFPQNVPAGNNYSLRIKGSNPLTYSSQVNEFPFSISKFVASDPDSFPTGYWRGSFYKWTPSITGTITNANTEDIFNPNNYLGYITEDTMSFEYNWDRNTFAPGGLPDTNNVCGMYIDFFSIRMKRRVNLEAGYYIIGGGADDGFRISIDGGATWLIDYWSDHGYQGSINNNGCGFFLSAGTRDLVVEFYENKAHARFRTVFIKTGDPAIDPVTITSPLDGTTICSSGSPVQMTSNAPGGFQWSGPGVSSNGILDPQIGGTGPRTITYQTGLSAFSQNCVKAASVTINVNQGLSAQFSGLQAAYCSNAGVVNLVPQNPGGTFSGPGVNDTTFSPQGLSSGTITIQHVLSSVGGCNDTARVQVEIRVPIVPLVILPGPICSGSAPLQLSANVAGTFSGPGVSGNIFTPAQANIGANAIVFTTVQGPCTLTASGNIRVTNQAVVSLSLPNPSFCLNQLKKGGITFSPLGGILSGPGVTGDSISVQGLSAGPYIVQYIAGEGACKDTASQSFSVFDYPDASFGNLPDTVCEGSADLSLVPLVPGGAFIGQGVVPINKFSPRILETNNTYQIEYRITKNGCTSRTEQFVNILDRLKPPVTFPSMKKRYCASDQSFIPFSIPAGQYFLNGNVVASIDPANLNPGQYILKAVYRPLTDLECIDSSSAIFRFTIIANPNPNLGPDLEIESGLKATIDPKVQAPYNWKIDPSFGQFVESSKPIVFNPVKDVRITVTAFDTSKTCFAIDSIDIKVRPAITFTNLITPNGDNKNDAWEIAGGKSNMEVSIFNRWGKEVYKGKTEGELAWDGKEAGESGVYFYTVSHPSDGRVWKGWLTVVKN